MAGGDHFLQFRGRHVGIYLRRCDVGVTEKRLDGAKVGAAVQKFGGEGVTQDVRTDKTNVEPGHLGGFIEELGEASPA